MRGRSKPPWASLPKYTPGQAPQRRRKPRKVWWEYAIMGLAALIAGVVKGSRYSYKRTPDGRRAAFAPPLRRRRPW
jgi:hypothetical protein